MQLTQQLSRDVKTQLSRALETFSPVDSGVSRRVDLLEAEKVTEKKTFEKLVKYVETSLHQLKDDFEGKLVSGSEALELQEVTRRMDQLANSWQSCNSKLRELQWQVSKLSEKTL